MHLNEHFLSFENQHGLPDLYTYFISELKNKIFENWY
jgi:hypothetical protein